VTQTTRRFRYHVFVSYSHGDQAWVTRWLVPGLKRAGLKICLDSESFEPGAYSLIEMERGVRESRKTLLVLTPSYLRSQWAEFENVLAQTTDPAAHARRVIPLLLRRCRVPLRFGALVRVDFTGRAKRPSVLARLVAAIRKPVAAARKATRRREVRAIVDVPTGALSPTSPIYVERQGDLVVRNRIAGRGSTVIVEGARQMGKTSLLARALALARRRRLRVVDFDFQQLDESALVDLDRLLRHLAHAVGRRLDVAAGVDAVWASGLSAKEKLTAVFEDHVLGRHGAPLVLVLDEVDRVFGRSYQHDFFGLLRSWHNLRATRPIWKRLDLVLAISADPADAIRDANQSPFNVGTRVRLHDLSPAQIAELNRRWRTRLRKPELARLVDLTGGQPYLVQVALHALATGTHTLAALLDAGHVDGGPFADHLSRHSYVLDRDLSLRRELRRALERGRCGDEGAFRRLRALGLVTGRDRTAVSSRCRLYREYFTRGPA
jgi:hypothetical protein